MESSPTQAMEHFRISGVELPPWTPTTEQLEGTEMYGKVLWSSEDGTRAMGVWKGTPGTIRGTFLTDEVSVITGGAMRVRAAGETYDVAAGDVIRMEAGLEVVWEISETVTKVFNVHAADGLPL